MTTSTPPRTDPPARTLPRVLLALGFLAIFSLSGCTRNLPVGFGFGETEIDRDETRLRVGVRVPNRIVTDGAGRPILLEGYEPEDETYFLVLRATL